MELIEMFKNILPYILVIVGTLITMKFFKFTKRKYKKTRARFRKIKRFVRSKKTKRNLGLLRTLFKLYFV